MGNFDPILVGWIVLVIVGLSIVLVNWLAQIKKQISRQAKADDIIERCRQRQEEADDMMERGRQSQERNCAILDRFDAVLSRIEAILERLEDRDLK